MTRIYIRRDFEKRHLNDVSECARDTLGKLLKKEHLCDISAYNEKEGRWGKPYLEGCPWHFNISHSGSFMVVAISDREVGVDVQEIRKISKKIARRYLNSESEDENLLTRLWAEHESRGKWSGRGVSHSVKAEEVYTVSREIDGAWIALTLQNFENDIVFVDI